MKLLDVAKVALYGIFLNYYCYYVLTGSFIPGGTTLFLVIALGCMLLDVLRKRYLYVDTEVKCWLVYAALAFITTGIVTADAAGIGYLGDIVKFVQRTAIIMLVAYICEQEGSIRFGLRLMAVTAIALAVSVFTVLGDYQLKLDITSGANLSDNDTGAIMACGCFAIPFAWGKRNRGSTLLNALKLAGILLCVSVMFVSGSRKSVYALLIMLGLMILLCLPDYGKHTNIRRLLSFAVIGVLAYVVISETVLPYMEQTSLYRRLFGDMADGADDSDAGRIRLYQLAIEHFLSRPLFGLGFNQFTKLYGVYTHSTYAEPLACSGLLGLLYLYPYYSIIRKQIYLIGATAPGSLARLKQKELFVYLCMFLFIGVGIPYMYKDAPCITLGTFLAHQVISLRQLRETGTTSVDY
jgi:hypothetical protein